MSAFSDKSEFLHFSFLDPLDRVDADIGMFYIDMENDFA